MGSCIRCPMSLPHGDNNEEAEGLFHLAEYRRLHSPHTDRLVRPWRKWGPYVSERSWGTVREDYSPHGTAWDFLTHDLARSKAYRWGEDGIAGIFVRY